MIIPSIHLNGTSGEDLFEQNLAVVNVLFDALEKMQMACPNARDYYPQGDAAFNVAMEEWQSRMDAVKTVREEFVKIMNAIDDVANP